MNAKKEQIYFILVYNEVEDIWEIKKQNIWYHEAKVLEQEYQKKSIQTKVIDKNHVQEFLNAQPAT